MSPFSTATMSEDVLLAKSKIYRNYGRYKEATEALEIETTDERILM